MEGNGNTSMVGVLILSHGCLARELLESAVRIAGELPRFEALCLDWDEPCDAAQERVSNAVASLDSGSGVLVLTDVFGGTPHNLAKLCCSDARIAMVSGVNLPMVLRLGCSQTAEIGLEALAETVAERGRASIQQCLGDRCEATTEADRQRVRG